MPFIDGEFFDFCARQGCPSGTCNEEYERYMVALYRVRNTSSNIETYDWCPGHEGGPAITAGTAARVITTPVTPPDGNELVFTYLPEVTRTAPAWMRYDNRSVMGSGWFRVDHVVLGMVRWSGSSNSTTIRVGVLFQVAFCPGAQRYLLSADREVSPFLSDGHFAESGSPVERAIDEAVARAGLAPAPFRTYRCEPCGTDHRDHIARCHLCGLCDTVCDCVVCDNCGTLSRPGRVSCSDCSRCPQCCRCKGRLAPIKFVKAKVDLGLNVSQTFRLNRSRRLAAAELEISSGGDRRVDEVVKRYGMSVVEDGSVHGGVEINTAPANGDALFQQFDDIAAALNASDAKADKACGMHVHIDCRDYSWPNMRRALLAWAHVEQVAYSLVPASRRSNRYCSPRAPEIVKAFAGLPGDAKPMLVKDRTMLIISNNPLGNRIAGSDRGYFDYARAPTAPIAHDAAVCSADVWRRRFARYYPGSFGSRAAGEESFLANFGAVVVPGADECDCYYEYRNQLAGYEAALNAASFKFHPAHIRKCQPVTKKRKKGNNPVGGDRYFAFNLQAWFEHGTVEIRLHPGTVDGNKMKYWTSLWCSFFDWAKAAKEADLQKFLATDPWSALTGLASTRTRSWMEHRRAKLNDTDTHLAEVDDVEAITALDAAMEQPIMARGSRPRRGPRVATAARAYIAPSPISTVHPETLTIGEIFEAAARLASDNSNPF